MSKVLGTNTVIVHGADLSIHDLTEENQSDIIDLQLELSEEEYARLLTHFNNTQGRWETSCYTYIFQSELAAFEKKCLKEPQYAEQGIGDFAKDLRRLSEYYAELEAMVNNPPQGQNPIEALIQKLETMSKELSENFTLPDSINAGITAFKLEAQKLRNTHPTAREIRKFFSVQKEDPNQPCLGRFIAEQLHLISAEAMKTVYSLTEDDDPSKKPLNRLKQMFFMHPLLKHLSDAQANIEKKGLSIYGARYNNSRDPVPHSMLDALKLKTGSEHKKWTSILPYLERADDLEEIDALIEFIKTKNQTKKKSPTLASVGVFTANIVELGTIALIRLALAVTAGLVHLCLNLAVNIVFKTTAFAVSLFNSNWGKALNNAGEWLKDTLNTAFQWFDEALGRGYRKISPIIAAKKYKNSELEVEASLKDALNQPQSYYDQLLTFLSSVTLVKAVNNGITSFFRTLFNVPQTLWSGLYVAGRFVTVPLFINPGKRLVNLFREKNNKLTVTSYQQMLANERETVLFHYNEKMTQAMLESLEAKVNDPALESEPPPRATRESVTPWEMSQVSSPLDFIDEIFVGLSDIVVSPMFRKSPGLSTFFFLLANASFTALMVPAFTSAVSSSAYSTWLKGLPKVLSEGFMGKHAGVHESMVNKLFATFLQWKLTFFTAEGIMEVSHGDMDFLKDIFHDPEKITLGMSVMVAMGWAMHYLPEVHADIKIPLHKMHLGKNLYLTNFYLEALNIFSHEAKEVTEYGMPPLTGLEYAFLSLKSIFLIENMASGNHHGINEDLRKFLEKKGEVNPVREILGNMRKRHHGNPLHLSLNEHLVTAAVVEYCNTHNLTISETLRKNTVSFFMKNANDIIPMAKDAKVKQAALIEASNNGHPGPSPKTVKSPVQIARDELTQAISIVQKMELLGQTFDSHSEATQFYDCLYHRFKAYNYAQRDAGNWDQQIDKEHFLHAFYNKHIHQGSNNLLRLISVFPFLPLTWAWRGLQSLNKSPAVQYKLKKSFAKDGVILTQLFGAIPGRTGAATVLAYTYGILALIPLTPTYIIGTVFNGIERFCRWVALASPAPKEASYSEQAMNAVIDFVTGYGFALYNNLNLERPQAFYGRQSRIADTNAHSLKEKGTAVIEQLKHHATAPESTLTVQYKHDFRDKSRFNRAARKAEKVALERQVIATRPSPNPQ